MDVSLFCTAVVLFVATIHRAVDAQRLVYVPNSLVSLDDDAGRYMQLSPPYSSWNSEGASDGGLRVALCPPEDQACAHTVPEDPVTVLTNATDPRYIRLIPGVPGLVAYVDETSGSSRSLHVLRCDGNCPVTGIPRDTQALDTGSYIGIFGAAAFREDIFDEPQSVTSIALAYPLNPADGGGCELRLVRLTVDSSSGTLSVSQPQVLWKASHPFRVPVNSSLPVAGLATVHVAEVAGRPFVLFWDCESHAFRGVYCMDGLCTKRQDVLLAEADPAEPISSPGAWPQATSWGESSTVFYFDLGVGRLASLSCTTATSGNGTVTCTKGSTLDTRVHGSGTGPRGAFTDYGAGGFPAAHMCRDSKFAPAAVLLYFSESGADSSGGGVGGGQLRAVVCSVPSCAGAQPSVMLEGPTGFGRDVDFAQTAEDEIGVVLLNYNGTGAHKIATFLRLQWAS